MIEPPFESKQGADGMLDKLLAIHQLIADQLKVAKAIQKHHADKRTNLWSILWVIKLCFLRRI